MRVLIAEDDSRLSAALSHILKDAGYEVDAAADGMRALEAAQTGIYDVIILDVMLPRADGFTVVRDLRRAAVSTPVLLLTARDAIGDKITGYDSGADDYMTKPFSPAELLAHLRALTRRQGDVVFETLHAGDLTLNLTNYELSCGASSLRLSQKEFALARMLMANPGTVIAKDELLEGAWGADAAVSDNNVEAYISFLRKKMGHVGSTARIETVRGVGYQLAPDQEAR